MGIRYILTSQYTSLKTDPVQKRILFTLPTHTCWCSVIRWWELSDQVLFSLVFIILLHSSHWLLCRCLVLLLLLPHSLIHSTDKSNSTWELSSKKLDFLLLTETWQHDSDYASLIELCPEGYSLISQPRTSGWGEGLAAVFPSHSSKVSHFSSFELLLFKVREFYFMRYSVPTTQSNQSIFKLLFVFHPESVQTSYFWWF